MTDHGPDALPEEPNPIETSPIELSNICIGVIIPATSPAVYLDKCIESVLNQIVPDHVSIIPIVVCAGSMVAFNITKPYKGKIGSVLIKRRFRTGEALNVGLKWLRERHSTLDLVVCVSSDDVVNPDFLSTIINADDGSTGPFGYSYGCVSIDKDGNSISKKRFDCSELNVALNHDAINVLVGWHGGLSYAVGKEMLLRMRNASIEVKSIQSKVYQKRVHYHQLSRRICTKEFTREGLIMQACRLDEVMVRRNLSIQEIVSEL